MQRSSSDGAENKDLLNGRRKAVGVVVEYADRENNSCFNDRLPLPPLMEVNSPSDSSGAATAGCSNSMTVGRPYQVISGADTTGVEYKCGGRRSLSLSLVLSRVDDDDVAPFLLE